MRLRLPPSPSGTRHAPLKLIVYSSLILLTLILAAQDGPRTSTVPPELATVEIGARVRARELVFEVVPNASVRFPGDDAETRQWTTERTNLPDRVEPGTIYRDIGIVLTIRSSLPNIEQLVDDALAGVETQHATPPDAKTMNANNNERN